MSYKVDESPYLFIDSLWNDTNYWINMTPRGKEISFSNLKIPKYFEAVLPENPEKDDEINAPLLLPLPWGCLPVLSRENFNFRFFKGERCGFYKKSQILNFSPFSQPDGLIRRHSIFKDVDRQIPSQINHIFYARKDGLVNRIQYPLKMEIFEEFKNIRPDSIKSIHKVEGESIDVEFYSDSRLDGVCRRTEIFDKELSETFIDRKDKLTFHSIKLDPTIECKNNEDLGIKVMNKTIFVKKMSIKFDRSPEKAALLDIAKVVFFFESPTSSGWRSGTYSGRVDYHYETGSIKQKSVDFISTDAQDMFSVLSLLPTHRQFFRDSFGSAASETQKRNSEEEAISLLRKYNFIYINLYIYIYDDD
eukprot:GHVL01020113.1.p1 GENE.GHVL01020113.1~~GHVL01020113.1.p1  ORF type:complete len:362 (+),score=82.84 GHVL01020113.1:1254-2339(+)